MNGQILFTGQYSNQELRKQFGFEARVRRFYKFYWRKYAALPVLILQIIGQVFLPNIITGFILALWLTIPCGIKYVNIYKWLWIPRQILFAAMSISYFIR